MAPLTDLAWNELQNALLERVGDVVINFDAYGVPESIDIQKLITSIPSRGDGQNIQYLGVVKAMSLLFDACRQAQQTVNTAQPTGEKLNAFAAPTTQAPVGTLVPIVRTMTARADLTSVSNIVGPNI